MNYNNKKKILITFITPVHILDSAIKKNIKKNQLLEKNLSIEFIYIFNGPKIKRIDLKGMRNTYFLKKANGPGIARNIGIKKARGKWLLFLDSDDDIILKNLSKLISFLSIKKSNFTAINFRTNNKRYYKNLTKFKLNFKKMNLKKRIKLFLEQKLEYAIIFYCFKKRFIIKNKIFFKDYYYEDILFLLKTYFYNKDIPISYFKHRFYFKKINNKSITSTLSENHINGFISAWKDVIQFLKQKKIGNSKKMSSLYQYTLRGVFGYLFKRVEISRFKEAYKYKMKKIIISNLKKYINKNFIASTNYDRCVKSHLKYEV
tara:strand:+ start:1749 stop:2699 length:951 start_codon:yes stop_codon:yes gene_type:complete